MAGKTIKGDAKPIKGVKTALLKSYYEKLAKAKRMPESSPRYLSNIEKISLKIKDIKKGGYSPTKTDIKKLPVTKTTKEILKNFNSDNESFYLWNSAVNRQGGFGDLSVIFVLRTIEGFKIVRTHHIDSYRLDGKITDSEVYKSLNETLIDMVNGKFKATTQSGYTAIITSYQIVGTYRDKDYNKK